MFAHPSVRLESVELARRCINIHRGNPNPNPKYGDDGRRAFYASADQSPYLTSDKLSIYG